MSHFGGCKWGYLVLYFVSFVMDIHGAKFQEHCFNISRDIVYSVFTTFQLQRKGGRLSRYKHHLGSLILKVV